MRYLFTALALLLVSDAVAQEPEQAAEPFDILEFRVIGNTTLSAAEIERAVYPSLGPKRSIADVEQARDALVQVYRNRGFGAVFVDIPEQDVVNGLVRLKVTEGRLDRVRVSGARFFANGRIRGAMPSLKPGAVLSFPAFQQELAAVNRRSPDRLITPVLRAGRTPGTVDLDLKVEDELPLHGSVEVSDRYTANTSRTRVGLNLSYDNLFQKFHSLSLQYQLAPEEPREASVLAATYVLPINSRGHSLAVYAVETDSDVATIGALSVLGAGRIFGARYIAPLPELGVGYFHSLAFGADYKDFEERIRLADSTDVTPIQYVNWTALYNGTLRGERTLTSFGISANFGVRGLANSAGPPLPTTAGELYTPGEFGFKRAHARPGYFYVRANAQHERPLFAGARLVLRLAGQGTTEPLISNEQFSIGGADSVRGYLESEELGDIGVSGTIELRTPTFAPAWSGERGGFYAFTFYDAGVVGIIDPIRSEDAQFSQPARLDLASAGVGLRFIGFSGLDAALDWAYPLVPTDDIEVGESRVHFQMRYGF